MNTSIGYSGATTLQLLSHLYAHYASILATDLADNGKKLREANNTDNPLESLYTRLNECVDYATSTGKPIIEGQIVHNSYSLVTETGKFQEDF